MVYVVTRNNKIDAVFTNREAAEHHQKNLIKLWALSSVVEKELLDI